MNKYEVMVIVKPAEEEATNAVIEKVEALIARVGGTVEKVDRWGKRRLAYAVKKFTDGFYVLINFEAAPAEIKEIDRQIKEVRSTAAIAPTLEEKLSWQKKQRELESKRSKLRRDLFARQDEVEEQRNNLIGELEEQLQQQVEERTLFTVEWELT